MERKEYFVVGVGVSIAYLRVSFISLICSFSFVDFL